MKIETDSGLHNAPRAFLCSAAIWLSFNDVIPQFFLDPEGRVPFAGNVSFDFRSAPTALSPALSEPGVLVRVVADCQVMICF